MLFISNAFYILANDKGVLDGFLSQWFSLARTRCASRCKQFHKQATFGRSSAPCLISACPGMRFRTICGLVDFTRRFRQATDAATICPCTGRLLASRPTTVQFVPTSTGLEGTRLLRLKTRANHRIFLGRLRQNSDAAKQKHGRGRASFTSLSSPY
jgi:hypothetical protein